MYDLTEFYELLAGLVFVAGVTTTASSIRNIRNQAIGVEALAKELKLGKKAETQARLVVKKVNALLIITEAKAGGKNHAGSIFGKN
jgi:hypothetical protein